MGIDFSKVNISLTQFQAQSKGKFNAGEVLLTGEKSLGIVNNHVGRLRSFNTTRLSHAEVLAVKQAFVSALSREGRLDSAALNDVRSELGLAPKEGDVKATDLHGRSIKPLSRQQVREILDRYAETINGNAANGAVVVRNSDELYGNVEKKERANRESTRDEVNASLSGTRTVTSTYDIQFFEAFVSHKFDAHLLADDEREKMLGLAQSSLKAVRERIGSKGSPVSEGTLKLELEGGNGIEFSSGLNDAELVARLEDDIFALSNQVNTNSDDPTPEEINKAYNRGVIRALNSFANGKAALPHDFIVMSNELLAEARTLFGEGVVPKDCWIGDLTDVNIEQTLQELHEGIGDKNKITPDDVREHVRASIRKTCVSWAIEQKLAEANGTLKTEIDTKVFMKREPGVAEALRKAETAEQVAKIFSDNVQKFQETVKIMSETNRLVPDTMLRIAQGVARKTGLPVGNIMEAMKRTEIADAGRKIADRIVTDRKATTRDEIAGVFRAEIEKYVNARTAVLDKIDALKLGPVATHKMKEQVLSLHKIDPKAYDLGKFHAIAQTLREDVEKLVALFNDNDNPSIEQVFGRFAPIRNKIFDAYAKAFPGEFDMDEFCTAANAIFAMIVPEDTDMPERAVAFMKRKDVLAAIAAKGADREANVESSYSLVACTMVHGMKNNEQIAASLGRDSFPPYHAKAMVDALHELGYTSVTGEVAMSIFREGVAFTELAGKIRASGRYVDPRTLKGMVKDAVNGNAAIKGSVARKADIAKVVGGDGEMAILFRRILNDRLKSFNGGLYGKVMEDIRKVALSQFTCGVSNDMHNLGRYGNGQMAKDCKRQVFRFGSGEPIRVNTLAELRDRYAQFFMKDPAAKYAALNGVDRRKIDIVMAFMTQIATNAVAFAVGLEFSPDGRGLPFQSNGQADWQYKIDWTEKGDLVFSFDGEAEIRHIMYLDEKPDPENGRMGGAKEIKCGEGSKKRYGIKIKLGAAELNRLATLDYSRFSTADYDKHVTAPNVVDPYQSAIEKIPERFRINAEFETTFSATLT